jgi:DNA-directed RNA polymerase subunit RPC12/RpoP
MILLEYHCEECGHDFESFLAICARCGKKARRDYRTAPQINTRRVAPKTDKILEREFKRRGIVNFTNSGGVSRPTFVSHGGTATTAGGVPQAPIAATFNQADLAQYKVDMSAMSVKGQPYSLPDPSKIATGPVPYGAKVGQMNPDLAQSTQTIGRTDDKGNVIEINGSNGR